MKPHLVLGIETSCDECSAAVVERTTHFARARSNVVFSQIDLHRKYGGVVPEIASRNHLEMLSPVIDEALEKAQTKFRDLDAVAVTQRPGLIGALLVGVSAAKAMAYALNLPLVGVNHLDGHLHSIFLDGQDSSDRIAVKHLPLLACLVSGGHTNLYLIQDLPPAALQATLLSKTRDDAAGEAFDKCAKLLGLPYPGGVYLDRLSVSGDRQAYSFPRPLAGRTIEFSFSGLKTALATTLRDEGYSASNVPQGQKLADFCASAQEAIVETLVTKIDLALAQTGARGLAVVGGVSANSRFRTLLDTRIRVPRFFPKPEYCTDNAAMIATAGLFQFERGETLRGQALLAANAFSS